MIIYNYVNPKFPYNWIALMCNENAGTLPFGMMDKDCSTPHGLGTQVAFHCYLSWLHYEFIFSSFINYGRCGYKLLITRAFWSSIPCLVGNDFPEKTRNIISLTCSSLCYWLVASSLSPYYMALVDRVEERWWKPWKLYISVCKLSYAPYNDLKIVWLIVIICLV